MSAHSYRVNFTLLLLTAAGPLHAAGPLTWQECIARTASNNIELAVARLKLKEAGAALKSQQSVYYPDVSARAGRTTGERETDGVRSQTDSLSASLNADYTLFDGFGNRARVTRAEAELHAEQANFDQTRSNVEYDLNTAFTELLYTQELIGLLNNIQARRADNVRLVELRYEGGRENKGSLLLKQAQQIEAAYDVEEAERALVLARQRLTVLMRAPMTERVTVEGALTPANPPEKTLLYDLARQTPAYRSAEANMKAAEQGFIVTRSQRFPQISASASLSGSGETELDTTGWQAGLAVSLPLFTGGQLSQDILIAGLQREQAILNAEQTMFDLMNSLLAALNTYRDRHAALRVQEAQLQAAELRAEVARAQYEQGLISFQDWDTIENALIAAQKNRLAGLRAAVLSEAAWQNTMGLSSLD